MLKCSIIAVLIVVSIDISASLKCTTNACDTVRCREVADCGPGQVRGKGGHCLCCDVCRTIIGEGEDCSSGSLIGGVISDNVACDESKDLICTQGVCRKGES